MRLLCRLIRADYKFIEQKRKGRSYQEAPFLFRVGLWILFLVRWHRI